jgi:chromosome segregation ATPase
MARETKSQLKQRVEDLKAKLREAEQRAEAVEIDTEELETAKRERDVARKAERKLRGELEAAKGRADNLDRELAEATAELSTALDRVAALEEGRGSACDEDHEVAENCKISGMRLVMTQIVSNGKLNSLKGTWSWKQ